MKDCEKKLLVAIYQNIKMGVQSIDELTGIVQDEELSREISDELSSYSVLAKECEFLARSEKIELADNNWFDKSKLWCGIKMKTLLDKSAQNLASMLIIGSQMGIIDIIKEKSNCGELTKELDELCGKLEEFQERNIQKLKPFLMETKSK